MRHSLSWSPSHYCRLAVWGIANVPNSKSLVNFLIDSPWLLAKDMGIRIRMVSQIGISTPSSWWESTLTFLNYFT